MSDKLDSECSQRMYSNPIINKSLNYSLNFYQWMKTKNKIFELTCSKLETLVLSSKEPAQSKVAEQQKPETVCLPGTEKSDKNIFSVMKTVYGRIARSMNYVSKVVTLIASYTLFSAKNAWKPISQTNFGNLILDLVETIFLTFVPEIDNTCDIPSNLPSKSFEKKKRLKKIFCRLFKITTFEIDEFYKTNIELLEKVQDLILDIKKSNPSTMEMSSIETIIQEIFQCSKQLQNSIAIFKLSPNDNLSIDIYNNLIFLRKNISKLQIILSDVNKDFVLDKFLFQMSFAVEQIRFGFDSLDGHIRQYREKYSEVGWFNFPLFGKHRGSYYSSIHDEHSDCSLYDSDYD